MNAADSFFAYRMPGECEIHSYSGHAVALHSGAEKIVGQEGFLIAPFSQEEAPMVFIPAETECGLPESVEYDAPDFMAETSTTRDEHRRSVLTAQEELRRILEETGHRGKCVISRVLVEDVTVNPAKVFHKLCGRYPDAFVFCFGSPGCGLWTGASPETLLTRKGNELSTMSLAGTRKSDTGGDWDEKNIEEQKLVTEFISGELSALAGDLYIGPRHTHRAGNVEHLMTPVSVSVAGLDTAAALKTANSLSPTPALSGAPRDAALAIIARAEKHRRGYYGGFIGPISAEGNFHFAVNIRSSCHCRGRKVSYAGGGITLLSDPDEEWRETEMKLMAMSPHQT